MKGRSSTSVMVYSKVVKKNTRNGPKGSTHNRDAGTIFPILHFISIFNSWFYVWQTSLMIPNTTIQPVLIKLVIFKLLRAVFYNWQYKN